MPEFTFIAAGATNQGLVRSNNEDAFFIDPGSSLFLVADGLGGHAGGEIASSTVIEVVSDAADSWAAWTNPAEQMPQLFAEADSAVRTIATGPLTNMGTTVAALFVRGERYWTAHAGDSRAYRLRGDRFEQLTRDHTPEQERHGEDTPDYRSGMITRAIGIGDETSFEITDGSLASGDCFLLCSDGLTDAVRDDHIARLLQANDPEQTVVDSLIAAALAAGGPDNVTVVMVVVR
ncbi:MAG: protein phosphatase 2C domain-containing protein [bacterium]